MLKQLAFAAAAATISCLSTSTHEYASQDKADELLMEAINAAVGNVDLDKALASLADSRRQAKAAYAR